MSHADEQPGSSSPDREAVLDAIKQSLPPGVLTIQFHTEEEVEKFLRAAYGAAIRYAHEEDDSGAAQVLREEALAEGLEVE